MELVRPACPKRAAQCEQARAAIKQYKAAHGLRRMPDKPRLTIYRLAYGGFTASQIIAGLTVPVIA